MGCINLGGRADPVMARSLGTGRCKEIGEKVLPVLLRVPVVQVGWIQSV